MIEMLTPVLPPGWRMERIGDIFDSWGGHTPSKSNSGYWADGIPWVSSKDVKAPRLAASTFTVTQKAVEETGLRLCPPGSVLVVVRSGILAHTLPVTVTEVPVAINQDLKAFNSDEPMLNDWLALFLRMSARKLLASSRRDGTTVQSVQYPLLKNILIPVPPVEQRRRIIATAEELLGQQEAVLSRLSAAQELVERYRRAVLTAACSGRLTEDWRAENEISISDDWLAALQQSVMPHRGRVKSEQATGLTSELQLEESPANWRMVRLGDVINVATGATPLRANQAYYSDGTIPWVTSGAVNAGLVTEPTEMITPRAITETNAKVFSAGTLLIAMYGEGQTRGRVAELGIEAATNQAVAALLFNAVNEVLRDYVRLFFEESYQRIRALSFGGVQTNLSLGVIKDTVIPLPSIEEQREIVRRVGQLLKGGEEVLAKVNATSSLIDHVGQAALAKAFRGELIS